MIVRYSETLLVANNMACHLTVPLLSETFPVMVQAFPAWPFSLARALQSGHGMEWNGRRFFHVP